jgi:peptidoglycan/LPS O-acetylase OafA/YrhL
LRIIAAAAVVILHYSDYFKDAAIGRFMVEHTWHFNLFVYLFFVVSGFVIARQYLGRIDDASSISRFLWRRLARIYPLHLATLAFYVMLAGALHFVAARTDNPARYPLSDLPAQLLLLHAVIGERLTFNFPSWSLSAEMACYLLFPVIALITRRRTEVIIAIVVLTLFTNSVWAEATATAPWADWINKGGAFRALPGFTLGMACHMYRDRIAGWPALPGVLTASLAAFIVLGWLLPMMAGLIVIYAIAILAIQADCAGRATLLSKLRFDHWSPLTYSCYMLHIPVATVIITLGSRLLPLASPNEKLALAPVAVVVLAFASVVSLRMFEDPLRRYLTEAYDRRAARQSPSRAIPRQESSR